MLLFFTSLAILIYSAFIFRLVMILRYHQRRDDNVRPASAEVTSVSVVVACRNEEKNIPSLLRSITGQDYPGELTEIIIADDNSSDGTVAAVNDFINKNISYATPEIKVIKNTSEGKKGAVASGVKAASGELILVTDADCRMDAGWAASYASLYSLKRPDIMLGRVTSHGNDSFASVFDSYESEALQGVTEAMALAGKPVMCNGANMAFRKDVYIRHQEELHNNIPSGDDMFLLHAVKKAGGRIIWNSNEASVVTTTGKNSFPDLLRQRARWASKAIYYSDNETILTAIAVFAANVSFIIIFACALFSYWFLAALPAAVLIKASADRMLIRTVKNKQKEEISLPRFILMDIIYPFYFISVFVLSFFPRMKQFRKS